ncbi:MAG: DUF4038 domain-containing protein [Verrucomicrobia bacterium]|nr:DUF4038 domain-containing protein [Verrucomicrobiota bacterium]
MLSKFAIALLATVSMIMVGGLSQAGEVLPLDDKHPISRIAFASCGKESRAQPIWESILESRPDVFIFAGDNIYADTSDMKVMKAKYARLASKAGYQKLLTKVPILATWDDHDYGKNDAGAEYSMRAESQKVFLDFFGEPKGSKRRMTPGIYDAKLVGPKGKRTQIILLDTRYFRGSLKRKPQGETKIAPGKNTSVRYAPQPDPNITVLGEAQWKWLEQQLKEPAELRLIVSSIQVVAEDHDAESWSNFPHEQERLFRLIRDTKASGVIILSGDVHRGEISVRDAGMGYPLFDITASGLTQARSQFRFVWPNRYGIGVMGWGNHFGTIAVDWEQKDPEVRLQILNEEGGIAMQRVIRLSLLKAGMAFEDQGKIQQQVEQAVKKRQSQLQQIRQSIQASRAGKSGEKVEQKTALHRGIHELEFDATRLAKASLFELDFRVTFIRPDGSKVTTDGFYDGDRTFRARAYCDTLGLWEWDTHSAVEGLAGRHGNFLVTSSKLPGKLKKHPLDSRQLMYGNGDWFLHIGDTAYRYVVRDEKHWQDYIDQAAQMGVTKVRTWFSQSRHNVEALFDRDRRKLDVTYWQEMDRRIAYAYKNHPHIMLQLIPFGEDTEELKRYAKSDRMALLIPQYAQARFSSYPNVLWCISNDREIVADDKPLSGRKIHRKTIDRIGRQMAQREPWKTLLTSHQSRFKGYSFVKASWSDIITVEDLDQVGGDLILKYRKLGDDPIVLDEDRYEQYRAPQDPRYFFRRLMWASLFSGGAATYGGLRSYEPRDYVPSKPSDMKNPEGRGVYGYFDAVRKGYLKRGGDDFVHIHKFFDDAKLTLAEMKPADQLVGGESSKWKCIQGKGRYLVYLANPSGSKPETDRPSKQIAKVSVKLPEKKVSAKWFNPSTGKWIAGEADVEGRHTFKAPASGDWVLLLQ